MTSVSIGLIDPVKGFTAMRHLNPLISYGVWFGGNLSFCNTK